MVLHKLLKSCILTLGILAFAIALPASGQAGYPDQPCDESKTRTLHNHSEHKHSPRIQNPDPESDAVKPAPPKNEDDLLKERYNRVHLAGNPFDFLFGNRDRQKPRHVVIGLDLSLSNPMVVNDAFALAVANYVRDEIEDLPIRSRVWLRTFGSDSATANPFRVNRTISRRTSSDEVSSLMRTLIRNVPQLVRDGKVRAQNVTNIVSFLTNMAAVTNCDRYDTTIILATDGVEDSPIASLRRPGATLPLPRAGIFNGCTKLLMLGVGQGRRNPMTTARLRNEWKKWADHAGFEEFVGLNNW